MKKRILSAVLALVSAAAACAGFAGCGGGDDWAKALSLLSGEWEIVTYYYSSTDPDFKLGDTLTCSEEGVVSYTVNGSEVSFELFEHKTGFLNTYDFDLEEDEYGGYTDEDGKVTGVSYAWDYDESDTSYQFISVRYFSRDSAMLYGSLLTDAGFSNKQIFIQRKGASLGFTLGEGTYSSDIYYGQSVGTENDYGTASVTSGGACAVSLTSGYVQGDITLVNDGGVYGYIDMLYSSGSIYGYCTYYIIAASDGGFRMLYYKEYNNHTDSFYVYEFTKD